jgi:opacity protein-like surface antigen
MMIKRLIKPLAITCLLSCALTANAKENLTNKSRDYNYFKVKAGSVQPTTLDGNSGLNTGDSTFIAGFAVARKFMDQFAAEIEYTHRGKNTAKYSTPDSLGSTSSWDAKADTMMFNLSGDLTKDDKIRPYLKAGIGYSRNKASDYITTTSSGSILRYTGRTTNEFAYQLGAGLSMAITPTVSTDFEYMYVNRGKIKTKSSYTMTDSDGESINIPSNAKTGKLKEYVITIGITIKF